MELIKTEENHIILEHKY